MNYIVRLPDDTPLNLMVTPPEKDGYVCLANVDGSVEIVEFDLDLGVQRIGQDYYDSWLDLYDCGFCGWFGLEFFGSFVMAYADNG